MKVGNFYDKNLTFNSKRNLNIIKSKKLSLYDSLVRTPVGYQNPKHSLKKVSNIEPQCIGGTKCKGSIPLRNFWDFFHENKNIKNLGYSTNKDGYGNCYLKSNSSMPISTSYVHNCSVMYLYNKNTQTHALYHALSDCSEDTINYMLRTLMPEGFTLGAIIPGDSFFYDEHSANMKNMLKLMKRFCPHALVNVYHSTLRYPEIVGKDGMVYQIENRKVQEQIKSGIFDPEDYGQATFRIIDLQGYNTFEKILYSCNTLDKLKDFTRDFKKKNYPKMMKQIVYEQIKKRQKIITEIEKTTKLEDLQDIKSKYSQKNLDSVFTQKKETLLIEELRNIRFVDDLKNFFYKVRFDLIKMDKLLDFFQKKKKEILK